MLNIRFCSDAEFTQDEILFDEPYARLAHFIGDDVQRDAPYAEKLATLLRGVIEGTESPFVNETGNAWTMDIDANVARLTCHFRTPVSSVELPTAWLVDALERWRDHLIAKKKRAP